jgi:23S rRNA (adenine2503-C2)-methyltransferase
MLTEAMTLKTNQLVRLDAAGETSVSRNSENAEENELVLFGLDAEGLGVAMAQAGEPTWRGRQLAEALYRQRIEGLDEITTLPKALRQRLGAEGWRVGRPGIAQTFTSVDGTERYLVECKGLGAEAGMQTVEAVWMPEGDEGEAGDGESEGEDHGKSWGGPGLASDAWESNQSKAPRWTRATICVSSQVGCAVNCQFCLTAKLGLQRNLTAGEIAGQVIAVLDRQKVEVGRDRLNVVFMGMGEPFLNYDNFMAAVRLLVLEAGLSPQRMTVSTSGIVPGIERFALEPAEVRPKLAISLNAPNDRVRAEIMPINRKWNIEAVMDAVRGVKLRPRERVTFEYVLLAGVTDQPEHAREVAKLARRTGLPVKVNLIAWNPGPGIPYAMPEAEAIERFKQTLVGEGVAVYLRKPRGRDIYAACGQLKRTVEG